MASPTEKVSLQSTYFKNVDIAGMFSYTAGELNVNNYQQNFAGLDSSLSNYNESGPIHGQHVASFGDFGISWQLNDRISIVICSTTVAERTRSLRVVSCSSAAPCSFPKHFTPAPSPATCIPPTNGIPAPFVNTQRARPDAA
jgi:hypothetical protein